MGCTLAIQPIATLEDSELDNDMARLAGCTPDFDVWNECINEPVDLSITNKRSAGGHISVGWDDFTQDQQLDIIKAMDATVFLRSVSESNNTDSKPTVASIALIISTCCSCVKSSQPIEM